MSTITSILALASVGLGLFGIALSLYGIRQRVNAEKAWVDALRKHSPDGSQLVLDFVNEGRYLRDNASLSRSLLSEQYLEQAVADLVRKLAAEDALSQDAVKEIEAALNQPSLAGRREYARKLAFEGMRGRVQIA